MHGWSNGHSLAVKMRMACCQPSHLLALGVSLLAHVGLISVFSAGGGMSFGDAGRPDSRPPMRVVNVTLDAAPDTTIKRVEESDQARRIGAAANHVPALAHRDTSTEGSGLPLLPPTAPHYFAATELTQKPFVTRDIPHDFALRVPGAPENAAIFLLLINEYGDIDKVIVENSSLPQSAQSELETSFKEMKFYPGEIRGAPVKSLLKIQIRLDSADAAIEKTMH